MTFGIRTFDASGVPISEFDGLYLRFVTAIRVEALASGSFTFNSNPTFTRYFFVADDPVLRTPPVITIVGNTLSWRPYATSPAFHTGGYILLSAFS